MSPNATRGRGEPIASDVRALPSAPSLEYERKEAKALLRQIRAGDHDALGRVQTTHPVALRDRRPDELRLADVHHVIAREYGFTSWPRLVEYFEEMERHRNGLRYNSSDGSLDQFEGSARRVIRQHQRGDPIVARELAHFVPRFYGRSAAEILATPITEDEARLVVAREKRRASWEELVERANASRAMQDRDSVSSTSGCSAFPTIARGQTACAGISIEARIRTGCRQTGSPSSSMHSSCS